MHNGENILIATIIDGSGNESEFSEEIELFLDRTTPVIEDFIVIGGPHLAIRSPEFSASLHDLGSRINPDSISLIVGEIDVPYDYNPDNGELTAAIEE